MYIAIIYCCGLWTMGPNPKVQGSPDSCQDTSLKSQNVNLLVVLEGSPEAIRISVILTWDTTDVHRKYHDYPSRVS